MKPPATDPNIRHEIPVSLGKPSLRRRLEAYYSLIAPDQIADTAEWLTKFDQIWSKFGGTDAGEQTLATKLAKKYGPTVRLLLAASSGQQKKSPSSTAVSSAIRDEAWYQLTDKERSSGIVQFTSDQFDPVAALAGTPEAIAAANTSTRKNNIAIHQCPRLDRIDQCRSLLPTTDPLYRAPTSKRDRSKKQPETGTGAASQDDKTTRKRSRPPACFSAFAEPYENTKGPFSVLCSIFENRQRVRVVVRYVNGIRGTVTGYLVAFDKHMNLILRDADEVYSPRVVAATLGDNGDYKETGLSKVEIELQRRRSGLTGRVDHQDTATTTGTLAAPTTPGWCVRQRHLAQILVRGDNVVLVYKAESERSAWPATSKSPAKSNYRNKSVKEVPPDQRVGTPGCLIYAVQRQQASSSFRKGGRRSDYTS
jgi:small nuclear ribonucleoprotein (snRNP)-like protein